MNWLIVASSDKEEKTRKAEEFLSGNGCGIERISFLDSGKNAELLAEKIFSADAFLMFPEGGECAGELSYILGVAAGKQIPAIVCAEEKNYEQSVFCSEKFPAEKFRTWELARKWLERNLDAIKTEYNERKYKASLLAQGISCTADSFEFYLEKEKEDICMSILNSGIDVNSRTMQGVPLICIATRNDNQEMIEWLLSRGADINAISADRGYSPVMDAVWRKNYTVAQMLIEKGASLNTVSSDGQPILVLAVGNGSPKLVKLLLDSGADPDIQDSMGMSARKYALLFKNEELSSLIAKAKPE